MTTPDVAPRCSTFALDLFRASPGTGDPTMAAHVAGCPRCRAYLEALEAMDRVRPPAPARPRAAGRWRRAVPAAGAFAVSAGVLLYVARAPDADGGRYVGVKGTPSVELLIHRDGETFLWDGRARIRPHDALALRVACEGLSHVAVASRDAPGDAWTRVKEVDCPSGPSATLPFTLLVDEEPVDERFAVVVSRAPLDDAALGAAAGAPARTADVWAVQFDLAKAAESPR